MKTLGDIRMMKTSSIILSVFFAFQIMGDATMKTIAFYEVRPCKTAPVIDGAMDDPAWKEAECAEDYYEYFKANPGKGALKTEFRMLYGNKGVYLGIINYDQNPDKIRAVHVTRDSEQLWQDDCAEIYFDPAATGIGFLKFVVNAIATRQDMKRIDAAVTLPGWSGSSWETKTSLRNDAWIIEAFFPWSDLGKEAEPGDIWMFDHVRYAYSSGNFQGVTWSPEGNYQSPENFGYLYFSSGKDVDCSLIGNLLSNKVAPPWMLPVNRGFLICSDNGKSEFFKAEQLVLTEKDSLDKLFKEVKTILDAADNQDKYQEQRKLFQELETKNETVEIHTTTPMEAMECISKIRSLRQQGNKIYWNLRIQSLLNSI